MRNIDSMKMKLLPKQEEMANCTSDNNTQVNQTKKIKYWPRRECYRTGACAATFWYGVAHCRKGEVRDSMLPSTGSEVVGLGFGCKDGVRTQVVLHGTLTSVYKNPVMRNRWA